MAYRFQDTYFNASPVLTYQTFHKWMLQLLVMFQVTSSLENQSCHKKNYHNDTFKKLGSCSESRKYTEIFSCQYVGRLDLKVKFQCWSPFPLRIYGQHSSLECISCVNIKSSQNLSPVKAHPLIRLCLCASQFSKSSELSCCK